MPKIWSIQPNFMWLHLGRLLLTLLVWAWVHLPLTWLQLTWLPLWGLVSWLIFTVRVETAIVKRSVWLAQYLHPHTFWRRRLQLGWLGKLWQLSWAMVLGLLLVLELLTAPTWLGWLLLASVPVLGVWERLWQRWLTARVQADYWHFLVRRFSVGCSLPIILVALVLIKIHQAQPWLIGLSWHQALNLQLSLPGQQGLLPALLRLSQSMDLTWHWLLQNTFGATTTSCGWLVVLWCGLFVVQAAFCLAWLQMLSAGQRLVKV